METLTQIKSDALHKDNLEAYMEDKEDDYGQSLQDDMDELRPWHWTSPSARSTTPFSFHPYCLSQSLLIYTIMNIQPI